MLRKALTLAFAATLALTASAAKSVIAFDTRGEDTLLVWTGDQVRKVSDFVAVIDFDRDSPRYGKVLRTYAAGSPLASALAGADDSVRAALLADISARLQSYIGDQGIAFPIESNIVIARR